MSLKNSWLYLKQPRFEVIFKIDLLFFWFIVHCGVCKTVRVTDIEEKFLIVKVSIWFELGIRV